KLIRDGQSTEVTAVLDAAPKAERELEENDDTVLELKTRDLSYFDRQRRRLSSGEKGALIVGVEQGGWASFGGLRSGDIIESADGRAVTCVQDLVPILDEIHRKRPRTIAFLVKRGIHTQFVELEPKWPKPAKDAK